MARSRRPPRGPRTPRAPRPTTDAERDLRDLVHHWRERGVSTREAARRLGLSTRAESTVRDIASGRRRPSAARAEEMLRRGRSATSAPGRSHLFFSGEGKLRVNLKDRRARLKAGRYLNDLKRAQQEGDFLPLRKKYGGKKGKIATDDGPLFLEADPDILVDLDDAGDLDDLDLYPEKGEASAPMLRAA